MLLQNSFDKRLLKSSGACYYICYWYQKEIDTNFKFIVPETYKLRDNACKKISEVSKYLIFEAEATKFVQNKSHKALIKNKLGVTSDKLIKMAAKLFIKITEEKQNNKDFQKALLDFKQKNI